MFPAYVIRVLGYSMGNWLANFSCLFQDIIFSQTDEIIEDARTLHTSILAQSLMNILPLRPISVHSFMSQLPRPRTTPSVSNYMSFDFLNLKFDHSSYSKNLCKYSQI